METSEVDKSPNCQISLTSQSLNVIILLIKEVGGDQMKLVLCLLSILSILLSMPVYGQDLIRCVEPFVYKDVALVPTRQFAKELGFTVRVDGNKIELISKLNTLRLEIGSKKIIIGTEIESDLTLPIQKFAGSSFLPAREIATFLKLECEIAKDTVRIDEALFPLHQGKEILIDISMQKIFCYENNLLVMQSLVSTAKKGRHNHLGIFKIGRKAAGPAYDKPYNCWLRYMMQFYDHHLMHGWPSKSAKVVANPGKKIGHPVSNGCVRLYNDFAKKLYEWAPAGTMVIIFA